MRTFEIPEPDYDRYSNRQLVAIPLAVLAIALLILGATWLLTGAPATMGIEFTGGSELTIETESDRADIEAAFGGELESIQEVVGEENQFILRFESTDLRVDDPDEQGLVDIAEAELTPVGDSDSVVLGERVVSPAFAGEQQSLALLAIAVAFIGMSLLAFVLFRTFIPSVAIVVSAFSDIMIPLAVMSLLDISLTFGTVAALLMLIGYSVDSDILLNNHILRRSGDFYESTYRAMRTGVTMTLTSMTAMFAMFVVATIFGIEILSAIGLILFVGLAADLMNTYMLNLSLLRWYKFKGVAR